MNTLRAALVALRAGRFAEALALVAPLAATDQDAALLAGLALAGLGESEAAAARLLAVAAARQPAVHPLSDLVAVLRPLGRAEAAGPVFAAALRQRAAEARPDPGLWLAAARYFHAQGALDAARAQLDQVLASDPRNGVALDMRGVVQAEAGDFAAAIEDHRAALAIRPGDPAILNNLGRSLERAGRLPEALVLLERAARLAPTDARIQVSHGIALLKSGDWRPGWAAFEWRHRLPGRSLPLPHLPPLPQLAPDARLDGVRILLSHDEGYGDTLMFLRFGARLARRGAVVSALVPAALARLLRPLPWLARVVEPGGALPVVDCHAPFSRLGFVLGILPSQVAEPPYLAADPALVAAWAARLPPRQPGQRRVGLVWAGLQRANQPAALAIDRRRSLRPQQLAALATIPDLQLVSLQAGQTAPDWMLDPMAEVRDFADTAAIIAGLDMVVSVDTAVAHLAGAMGRNVLLLDRFDHCWRWPTQGEAAGWYGGMTILRQTHPGDWSGPIAESARRLA